MYIILKLDFSFTISLTHMPFLPPPWLSLRRAAQRHCFYSVCFCRGGLRSGLSIRCNNTLQLLEFILMFVLKLFEFSGTYLNSVLSKNLMFLERTSNTSFFGLELSLWPSAIYNVFMYFFFVRLVLLIIRVCFHYFSVRVFHDPFIYEYRSCSELFSSFLCVMWVSFPLLLCFCFLITSALATVLEHVFLDSLIKALLFFTPVFASVFINSIFMFLLLPEFSFLDSERTLFSQCQLSVGVEA